MSQVITLETDGRVVELNPHKKHVGFFSLFFTLLIFLSLLAGASFGVGFLIGRISINQSSGEINRVEPKITDQKNGFSLYSDSGSKFQVTFPTTWKAADIKTNAGGASFTLDQTSVQFWLVIDQPVTLSDEQKGGIDKTNQISLKINGQEAKATEYVYTNGTFLTSGSLDATDKTAKVSFLIKADNQQNYDAAKTLVQTFEFTD